MSGFDLSNFLASFFDEARERLNSINQSLVQFENHTLDEEGMIRLRRDAHTIKGSALMLGVTDMGKTAHLFEDMMEQLIEHAEWRQPETTQFLYNLHDALDDRLQYIDSEQRIPFEQFESDKEALIQQLKEGTNTNSPNETAAHQPDDDTPDASPPSEDEAPAVETVSVLEGEQTSDALNILSDLDSWLQSDDITPTDRAPEEVKEPSTPTSTHSQSEGSNTETMAIGADEALAWKQQKNLVKQKTEQSNEAQAEDKHSAISQADSTTRIEPQQPPLDTHSEFRPEMEAMEMAGTAQRKSSGRFLRVDAERLENLSNQVVELSTEQMQEGFETQLKHLLKDFQHVQRSIQDLTNASEELDDHEKKSILQAINHTLDQQTRVQRRLIEDIHFTNVRNERMMRDLRDQVLSLMLRPLDNIFSTFPRSVRDVAVRLNKKVRLMVGGKSIEMDQGVTESLLEPLVHLLNNAVAHGIESPEERIALGKPEEGQISITARQNGSEIQIEVMDDGRGLDTEKIKHAAVSKGVTTQVEADQMDSAEILEMIFRPGFTTKKTVDDTSGRGIGMNIVQDTVRRLTGSIRIHSEVGKGTRFTLSLPVSIAVQFAIIFRMGKMRFAMLTHMVEQAIPYHASKMQTLDDGKQFINYGKYQVPLVDMRHVLGQSDETHLSSKANIIIAEHIEGYVGIVVDEIINDVEIIVRDLDPYLKRYNPQGLMGNTIASDGSVIMLLEPYGIKEMGRTSPDQSIDIQIEHEDKLSFSMLLVDDSLIAREVEKSIFESIGFRVDTAIDGMDALEKLQHHTYDMIVTDLEMPRLDGFGLVRRIRNQSELKDMPLVVISTRESAEDRLRALESGADSYMVKQQLNGDEILHTVRALLGAVPDTSASS